jgi:membrane-associated phospholipid phosphatase
VPHQAATEPDDDDSGEMAMAFVRLQRPSSRLLVEELAQVLAHAELRAERSAEILSQIDGQWAHWASILPLRADRTPHTLALLTVALQWAIAVELRFKHWLACPRPMVLSPQVQPCVTTPGHGSYPMGHAVQAFLIASLLQTLSGVREHGAWGIQLNRTAFRIAVNRVVAGLHFPVDLVAGLVLGKALARYAQAMAQPASSPRPWRSVIFDPQRYLALGPLGGLHDSQQVWRHCERIDREVAVPGADRSRTAPVWAELWRAAAQEWQAQEVQDV